MKYYDNGSLVNGDFCNVSDAAIEISDELFAELCRAIEQGKVIEVVDGVPVAVDPVPPERTVFPKLAIRRAMRQLKIEEKLDALLEASAEFRADWTDAQEIDLADPVLVEALAAGSITASEIDAVKRTIG